MQRQTECSLTALIASFGPSVVAAVAAAAAAVVRTCKRPLESPKRDADIVKQCLTPVGDLIQQMFDYTCPTSVS